MLTDDDLRELIQEAADAAPAPAVPNPAIFEDVRADGIRRIRRPKPRTIAFAAAAVALVAVSAVGVIRSRDDHPAEITQPAYVPNFEPVPGNATVSGAAGGGAGAGPAATGQAASAAAPQAPALSVSTPSATTSATPALTDSARVVKNGSIELGVGKGAMQETIQRITAAATGLGGYVSQSQTAAGTDNGRASGTITVRVPSDAFDPMITEVTKLGEVRSETASGSNVTAQYTDLEARIGALQATHDQLLTILTQAESIPDILAVQDRLTDVQVQIDSLKGQLQVLTDQTAYGTVAVTVLEPGATTVVPAINDNGDLGDAWDDAKRHFGDGIETIVASSGTAAVIAAVLASGLFVVWVGARIVRRRLV